MILIIEQFIFKSCILLVIKIKQQNLILRPQICVISHIFIILQHRIMNVLFIQNYTFHPAVKKK